MNQAPGDQPDALLQPWVDALGTDPAVLRAGRDLVGRYDQAQRRYHDRRHLGEVLRALGELTTGATPAPVLWAAYFHDAVYEPAAHDNEQRSADLAAATLRGLGVDPAQVDEVVRLVLLTTTHDPAADDAHGGLLCDADLAILAAAPDRYRAYATDVRREHGGLDEQEFRRGRAAVLRTLVDRPRLFTTAQGHRRWDAPARRNLQQELSGLGAAPLP